MSGYADIFREFQPGCDPRHLEAYARLKYGTLSHLSRDDLREEAEIGAACIKAAGIEGAERLAKSFGL